MADPGAKAPAYLYPLAARLKQVAEKRL